MKKAALVLFLLCTFGAVFLVQPTEPLATPIVVELSGLNSFPQAAGDYTVQPQSVTSAPGQIVEILGGPQDVGGELHFQGSGQNTAASSETATNEIPMSDIVTILTSPDFGLTSASQLGVSFGQNELAVDNDGVVPWSDYVLITALTMTFPNPFGDPLEFDLGEDTVEVGNYGPGQSEGEALFITPSLGYDIIAETWGPTDTFTISSTITWVADSFEVYFLDPLHQPQPPAPVPEPTTMLLLGSGLIGLVGFRRKFRK